MNLLITNKEELQEYLSDVGDALTYTVIKSDIKRAQKRWLLPVLGSAMLDILTDESSTSASASSSSSSSASVSSNLTREEAISELAALAGEALAHLAFSLYFPKAQYKVTSHSIHKPVGENSDPLSYFEVQEAAQQYLEEGLLLLDDVYAFLEEHQEHFSAWKNSTAYVRYHNSFIKSATQFNEAVNIGNSRRTFKALAPYINHVETINLVSRFGKDLIEEIRGEIKKSAPNEEHVTLAGYLRKLIAHSATINFLSAEKVKLDRNAIIQIETAGDHIDKKYQANRGDIEAVRAFHVQAATEWATIIQDYLNDNDSEFQNYTAPVEADGVETILHGNKLMGL